MKKLPDDYRLRQRRITNNWIRENKKQRKKRGRARRRYISGFEIISAPHSFAMIPENIDEVIRFIGNLSKKGEAGEKVTIDFSNTQFMSALGAVYIHSAINNIQGVSKGATVRIRTETVSSPQVWLALKNTGLFQLCGSSIEPDPDFLPIIQGQDDDHLPIITKYLMNTALFREQLGTTNQHYVERLVSKAIGEAMLNVKYHAYPGNKGTDFWWITAAIIREELHIALCDRGVGIPQTLLKKGWFKPLKKKLIPGVDDAEMIKEAMEYTRSSRKVKGVGLGSRDIQELVLDKGSGHLTIISGMGHYHLQGNKDEIPTKIGYDVNGTLIQWRIPLQH